MAKAQKAEILTFPAPARLKPETGKAWTDLYEGYEYAALSSPWLKDARQSAATAFAEQGLPTTKLERWKYTNLPAAVGKMKLTPGPVEAGIAGAPQGVETLERMLGRDKIPDWVKEALRAPFPGQDKYGDGALWNLATMFSRDGIVIDIPETNRIETPVEIAVNTGEGAFACPRLMIRLGAGAALTLIERHTGAGAYWKNRISQIFLGPGATLRHYRMQEDSREAVYTETAHLTLAQDATYEAFTLTAGAKLSRNQIHAELQGTRAHALFGGLNLLTGDQHADATITVEHQAPGCPSNQNYKSVIADRAHAVFQGKVHVHRAGQKTDGYQLSNALLLSPEAEMDTKPELEIYADDVKCSHGATTGQLDGEPLFYLRSRGIPERQARALLIQAFAAGAAEQIADETVRQGVHDRMSRWLEENYASA